MGSARPNGDESGVALAAPPGEPEPVADTNGESRCPCGGARQAQPPTHRALNEATERHLADASASAYRALGLLELAAGRPGEAVRHFEAAGRGTAHSGIGLTAVPDLVEAAVRAGLPERAAEPFARFAAWAQASQAPELLALSARCRALLALGDGAEAEFRLALELHAKAEDTLERARTELLFGGYLRRARRRSEARPHLRAALETFHLVGALVWADRAQGELRTAGGTGKGQVPRTLAALTPQELRVVAAVSGGATNREVGAQLFLSPRTVDYHLRNVFRKLGIGSRTELIRLTLTDNGHADDRWA